MTAQEEALEFMLFDLTSCQTPPPAPITTSLFRPAAFTEDIVAQCDTGMQPLWRRLEWDASVPDSSFISFSAQTLQTPADGGAPDWTDAPTIALDTVVAATPEPGAVDLDTGDGGALLAGLSDAGDASTVPGDLLRLTVALNPTPDGLATPTLFSWQVLYDCVATE
jgi:hypothetical protein